MASLARLLPYAAFACLGAAVLAGPGLAAERGSFGAQAVASRLINAHNRERAMLGSPQMVWSPALAAAARAYADTLAATGRWGHSPAQQRRGQGENLWMGTRGAFTPEQMIGDWASERRLFRPGTFPNVSRTGSWHDVGHYTQMVWPETRQVGCAISSSYRFDYLVCRYASPGNIIGRQIAARAPGRPGAGALSMTKGGFHAGPPPRSSRR